MSKETKDDKTKGGSGTVKGSAEAQGATFF